METQRAESSWICSVQSMLGLHRSNCFHPLAGFIWDLALSKPSSTYVPLHCSAREESGWHTPSPYPIFVGKHSQGVKGVQVLSCPQQEAWDASWQGQSVLGVDGASCLVSALHQTSPGTQKSLLIRPLGQAVLMRVQFTADVVWVGLLREEWY